jgi:imidazolonepropionase-like amidohydrolase
VKIAFGTDTGVSPHGMNAKEFALMVAAGMPPAEAIQSATLHAAEVLGASGELGVIAPGAHADIVVVAGDPTADITLLERPQVTYKAGQAYAPM